MGAIGRGQSSQGDCTATTHSPVRVDVETSHGSMTALYSARRNNAVCRILTRDAYSEACLRTTHERCYILPTSRCVNNDCEFPMTFPYTIDIGIIQTIYRNHGYVHHAKVLCNGYPTLTVLSLLHCFILRLAYQVRVVIIGTLWTIMTRYAIDIGLYQRPQRAKRSLRSQRLLFWRRSFLRPTPQLVPT